MARGNEQYFSLYKSKKISIFSKKKRFRAVAADRKYQESKIIGIFGMLINSYIFQKDS